MNRPVSVIHEQAEDSSEHSKYSPQAAESSSAAALDSSFPPPPFPSPCSCLTHEVVVPGALRWHHEEAKEAVRQQHLHPLVVGRQVALGVVALVRVLPAPLVAAGSQLVGRQRAGAGGEAAAQEGQQ